MDTSPREAAAQKNPIESLSKDEIISKYKGLLTIAKKAKQAKDDLTEENRQLKDALTRAAAKQSTLPAMQEMVQDFTDKNLILTEQLSTLQRKTKDDNERLMQLEIENESLKRQLGRLSDENDGLLADIERMEEAMQQVNALGNDQRQSLKLLEVDIAQLREAETQSASLSQQLAAAAEETQAKVAELEELQEKYQHVKDLNSEQRKKFNALKDRFIDVHRKLKNLKECKCVLLETQHEYAASVSKWQEEIIKASQLLCAKMTALQQENEELRAQLDVANSGEAGGEALNRTRLLQKINELERLSKLLAEQQLQTRQEQQQRQSLPQIDHMVTKLNAAAQLAGILKEQQQKQQEQQKAGSVDVDSFKEKLERMQQLTVTLGQERSHYQLELQRLQQELHDLKTQLQSNANAKSADRQADMEYAELRAQLEASQATVAKLQEEMHIKAHKTEDARRLEAENVELQTKLQAEQASSADLLDLNEELQARYQQKESEHAELLAEMRELNEALKARGDVISRMQEQHATEAKGVAARQKELDGRLEQDQQALLQKSQQLEQLQARVAELEQELQQANVDAQSDVLSTSTISRAEELQRLRELDDGYEDKYNKLRALAARLKKKLQDQTQQIKEMDQQAAAAVALQTEVEAIRLAQAQLQQDLNAARAENQKLKGAKGKNTKVLNLEIEAAEKSLAEVSAKLTAKSAELDALRETLATKENSNVQLRREIGILEQAKNSEVAHAKQLKDQIDRMQAQVKDAVHSQQQALTQNKELEQSVERHKLEVEELRLQLATSAQQHEAKMEHSQQLVASTAQQLQTRLDAMGELETALRHAERAHEDLRVEYLDYKVKAQAVLRKNQNKGSDKEYELEAELATLRVHEQELRKSNEEQLASQAQLQRQLELLQEDNANLQRRSKELLALVEELRQQNESLAQDNQRQMQQQQERLQQHRQQIDHMDDSHKMQLQQLREELEQTQRAQQTLQQSTTNSNSNTLPVANPNSAGEQGKIDYLLMEHASGDATAGDYSNDSLAQLAAQRKISTASRRSHDFMPLDELLNTSMQAISSDTVTTISNFGRSLSQQQDEAELEARCDLQAQVALQATKERLGIQEGRVRHLTALLAENEQDLAKLTQMNDMLKEELRRQERSEEREQHMHNSEYLKNVFLKFLTLNNGDERMRLVPVLNTILRLSRSETEMLNCVAKGQKVSADGSNRGWSGFMSALTGGGGASSNNNNHN